MLGSLTYHYFDTENIRGEKPSDLYANKTNISPKFIANTLMGMRFTDTSRRREYDSTAIFMAEDSVGFPTLGLVKSLGYDYSWIQFGFILGMYLNQHKKWYDKGIENPVVIKVSKDIGIIPLVGIEINFRYFITRRTFLKMNNLITPIISNHTVGIGWVF